MSWIWDVRRKQIWSLSPSFDPSQWDERRHHLLRTMAMRWEICESLTGRGQGQQAGGGRGCPGIQVLRKGAFCNYRERRCSQEKGPQRSSKRRMQTSKRCRNRMAIELDLGGVKAETSGDCFCQVSKERNMGHYWKCTMWPPPPELSETWKDLPLLLDLLICVWFCSVGVFRQGLAL